MGMNRFNVFSKRLQREIRLYNPLQYDHWVLIETNLAINNYCERPLKIVISVAGEIIESIFDMWVSFANEEEFRFIKYSHEIDPTHKRSNPKAIKELYAQKIWCEQNNKKHKVLTELDIRTNPYLLSNKKIMFPYYIPLDKMNKDLTALIKEKTLNSSLTIRELEKSISNSFHPTVVRNHIYGLIYHNILDFDEDNKLITSLTEVTLNVTKTIEEYS
jgi:hypothetical protein